MEETNEAQKFADIKDSVEETRFNASDYFSKKKWDQAIKLYRRIFQIVELSETSSAKEASDRLDLLTRLLTNLAICCNKKEEWSEAMNHIRRLESLGSIDNTPKVLYAKGRALTMLGENAEASAALTKALKLRPSDKQIIEAIEQLTLRKNTYENFRKSFAEKLKLVK